MIAKAATSTMMVTTTKSASFSSWSALKRLRFMSIQSRTQYGTPSRPATAREQRLLEHERRCGAHAGQRRDARDDGGGIGHARAARLEHEQVRVGGDDPVPDAVLEAGHDGEHDDERGHAEEDAAHADPDEEREVGAAAARGQVPQAEK